jgi:hypothetical protein
MITSYDVLTRIADGLAIERGLMGLALVPHESVRSRMLPAAHDRNAVDLAQNAIHPGLPAVGDLSGQVTAAYSLGTQETDEAQLERVQAIAADYLRDDPVTVFSRASALADGAFSQLFGIDQPSRESYDRVGYLYAMLA